MFSLLLLQGRRQGILCLGRPGLQNGRFDGSIKFHQVRGIGNGRNGRTVFFVVMLERRILPGLRPQNGVNLGERRLGVVPIDAFNLGNERLDLCYRVDNDPRGAVRTGFGRAFGLDGFGRRRHGFVGGEFRFTFRLFFVAGFGGIVVVSRSGSPVLQDGIIGLLLVLRGRLIKAMVKGLIRLSDFEFGLKRAIGELLVFQFESFTFRPQTLP